MVHRATQTLALDLALAVEYETVGACGLSSWENNSEWLNWGVREKFSKYRKKIFKNFCGQSRMDQIFATFLSSIRRCVAVGISTSTFTASCPDLLCFAWDSVISSKKSIKNYIITWYKPKHGRLRIFLTNSISSFSATAEVDTDFSGSSVLLTWTSSQ